MEDWLLCFCPVVIHALMPCSKGSMIILIIITIIWFLLEDFPCRFFSSCAINRSPFFTALSHCSLKSRILHLFKVGEVSPLDPWGLQNDRRFKKWCGCLTKLRAPMLEDPHIPGFTGPLADMWDRCPAKYTWSLFQSQMSHLHREKKKGSALRCLTSRSF